MITIIIVMVIAAALVPLAFWKCGWLRLYDHDDEAGERAEKDREFDWRGNDK